MKREIKFRGKDETLKKWLYGDLLQYNDGSVCIGERSKTFTDDGYQSPDYSTLLGIDEETIGQFTGFHDKNGKEIYQHDIIQLQVEGEKYNCLVEWNINIGAWCISIENKCVGIKPLGEWLLDGSFVVIGNVFDNPELLED